MFLVFNRREELRESLRRMVQGSNYGQLGIETIVVDNASEDGSAAMVREEFPDVRLIVRGANVGVSAWNDGFAVARGGFVLALDDDCYLPPGGLRRAMDAAEEHGADLVSFSVVSAADRSFHFTDNYRTGLLAFWGCAVLVRRPVLEVLKGYDPEIFVWANEVEFTMRLFDRGFRHLHLPEVEAVHMKAPPDPSAPVVIWHYRMNTRNLAYAAGKALAPRDAAATLAALLLCNVRDAVCADWRVLASVRDTTAGFARGLRRRSPVRPEISRVYRRAFHSFASPLELSHPPSALAGAWVRRLARSLGVRRPPNPAVLRRYDSYYAQRARYYPDQADVLSFELGA